jgi:transposase
LFWDNGGLVLVYKRLEKGRFRIPKIAAGATEVEMDTVSLAMLLDGIDVGRVVRPSRWTPKTGAGRTA